MRERAIRYTLAGLLNTITNLIWFNLLIFLTPLSIGNANLVATVVSIMIGFWLNLRYVFPGLSSRKTHHVFILFLMATIFSQFIVQQAVLLLFLHQLTWPATTATMVAHHFALLSHISNKFWRANVAKCLAVLVSMLVNFALYNNFVFRGEKHTTAEDGSTPTL
jgi:putative flippase GtrA